MAQLIQTSVSGGDGNIFNDNAGSWATVKALTTGTAQSSGDPVNVYASNFTSRSLSRIFIPFLTSNIGADKGITSASLSFNVTTVFASNGTLHVVQSTQSDPTSLANGDFANIPGATSTMTSGGSVAVSTTGIKTITLNSTALTWISSTGYTKLALVEDHDLTNTDPSASDYRFGVNMAENGTAGNRPTLTINFDDGSSFTYFI